MGKDRCGWGRGAGTGWRGIGLGTRTCTYVLLLIVWGCGGGSGEVGGGDMPRPVGGQGGGGRPTGEGGSPANSGSSVDRDRPRADGQDSDGDGLSDAAEVMRGLDPGNPDTDADGVSDLVEVIAGTDGSMPDSNPRREGDFYFVVPYDAAPRPASDTLVFATQIRRADVFVLLDTTASMLLAIQQLQEQLQSTFAELQALIPDVTIGVGTYDDYPVIPYGVPGVDQVFHLVQGSTTDVDSARAAVGSIVNHVGGDVPEAAVPALWAAATGAGLGGFLPAAPACPGGGIGYPCFRVESVPIILLVTDAMFHNGPEGGAPYSGIVPPPPTYLEAVDALNAIGAKVIGISTAVFNLPGTDSQAELAALARDTSAVYADGAPIVFDSATEGAGLGARIAEAVAAVSHEVPLGITVRLRDDPGDDVDATRFIERITASTRGGVEDPSHPGRVCPGGLTAKDADGDGVPETFVGVTAGTPVCFDIEVRRNRHVVADAQPQVYSALIDVLGDQNSVLSTRRVFFLVPPEAPLLE